MTLACFSTGPPVAAAPGLFDKPASPVEYAVRLGNWFTQAPIQGPDYSDFVTGVAVDATGNAYIAGTTSSPVFPNRGPQLQLGHNPTWGFLAKLRPDGREFAFVKSLPFDPIALAVDLDGNSYLTARVLAPIDASPPRLLRANFESNSLNVLIAKYDSTGDLVWHSYVGGSQRDWVNAIAVHPFGYWVAVTGWTESPDFPTSPGVLSNRFQATGDYAATGFVAKLSPSGIFLVFSTFLGGSQTTVPQAIALDAQGSVFVAGSTSSPDFPVTSGALQTELKSAMIPGLPDVDAFAAKVKPDGTGLWYATYLGGTSSEEPTGIAVDVLGNAYVTGSTNSPDFPLSADAPQQERAGPCESVTSCDRTGFLAKINSTGSALVYSTYVGGAVSSGRAVAVDSEGDAFVTGETYDGLPAVRAFQASYYSGRCFLYTPSGAIPHDSGPCRDAFVAGVVADGSRFLVSTYLNGYHNDHGNAIAAGPDKTVYVAGYGELSASSYDSMWTKGNAFVIRLRPDVAPISFTGESIVNAASFTSGLASPGGLGTIFCSNLKGIGSVVRAVGFPLPYEVAGVSVSVGGFPAPLLAVADWNGWQQINFQVPFEMAGLSSDPHRGTPDFQSADVVVKQNGNWGMATVRFDLAPPEVFQLDGAQGGAIQHASDYRLVTASDPAERGEAVIVYATGLGAVEPALPSGQPAPLRPLSLTVEEPTVTIGGRPAPVLFSGLAPTLVGVYQLNVQIPDDAPSGEAELILSLPPVPDYWEFHRPRVPRSSEPVRIAIR